MGCWCLFGILVITFILAHSIPGNPVQATIGELAGYNPVVTAKLEAAYHYNDPNLHPVLLLSGQPRPRQPGVLHLQGHDPVVTVIEQTFPFTLQAGGHRGDHRPAPGYLPRSHRLEVCPRPRGQGESGILSRRRLVPHVLHRADLPRRLHLLPPASFRREGLSRRASLLPRRSRASRSSTAYFRGDWAYFDRRGVPPHPPEPGTRPPGPSVSS